MQKKVFFLGLGGVKIGHFQAKGRILAQDEILV